jgi:4-amino-4-deoxy-L-arabinose transferase-like glycosyltransferase
MSGEDMAPRRFFALLALLTIVGAALRLYWLSDTQPTGDEYYTIAEAFDYMVRGHYGLEMWHHPKLRNILVFLAIKGFGANTEGFRAASLAFGILTIPLTGLVGRRLTRSDVAALLAASFVAFDAIHIELSRQAIQEVYMPFFLLLGIYLALRHQEKKNMVLLVLSGVTFGLGLASKWHVAVPLALTLMLLVYLCLKQAELSPFEKSAELLLYFAVFVVLPLTTYVLTYYPWLLHRGYDLGELLFSQKLMFNENLVHKGANPEMLLIQDHSPLLWFLRPVGFADFVMNGDEPVVVLGVSNPLVWLLTLPAVGYLAFRIRTLNWQGVFLLALFWFSYLPFVLSRRLTGANTSLTVTPFAFMAVASAIMALLKDKPRRYRYIAIYVGAVLLISLPLYLLAIGKGYGTLMQPILEMYRPPHER